MINGLRNLRSPLEANLGRFWALDYDDEGREPDAGEKKDCAEDNDAVREG